MKDQHTESQYLREIWRELNQNCFNSALREPNNIGWLDLSGEEDLEQNNGYYFPNYESISLSHRFQYAEEQAQKCEEIGADQKLSPAEKIESINKYQAIEIIYRILAHEMVHQAAHQAGESPSSHEGVFTKHAKGVVDYFNIPDPKGKDAEIWPDIRPILVSEINAGNIKA